MSDQYEDISYLTSRYPDSTKLIMETVRATCDEYDYQGSCIYDEYPDRVWMERIAASIYHKVQEKEPLEAQDGGPDRDFRRNLVDILLLNEILCRRGWCQRGRGPGWDWDHGPGPGPRPDRDDWKDGGPGGCRRRDCRRCRD